MIISASRRTDIPAWYADWFFRRWAEGFVDVVHPFRANAVRRVSLRPEDVDGIVFWTRRAGPILDYLDRLGDTPFYFQYTLTPYGTDLEPGLPDREARITDLLQLADRIGPERVIWRYDPIVLNADWTIQRHEEMFGALADRLCGAFRQGVFSFLDAYAGKKTVWAEWGIHPITETDMRDLAERLSRIASSRKFSLDTCAEPIDLSGLGVAHGRCVDPDILTEQSGIPIAGSDRKDPGQRPACRCAPSVDIGRYNTCPAGCRYCYACRSQRSATERYRKHQPEQACL